jgi:hypothetical protein
MTTVELIANFSKMLDAPDGSAFVRVEERFNKKTWKGGRVSEWKNYDVMILYVKDRELREIHWCLLGGRIKTLPVILSTNLEDLQFLSEFQPTNRAGVLDALNKFFYDSRESRYSVEELKKMEEDFILDQSDNLLFINE